MLKSLKTHQKLLHYVSLSTTISYSFLLTATHRTNDGDDLSESNIRRQQIYKAVVRWSNDLQLKHKLPHDPTNVGFDTTLSLHDRCFRACSWQWSALGCSKQNFSAGTSTMYHLSLVNIYRRQLSWPGLWLLSYSMICLRYSTKARCMFIFFDGYNLDPTCYNIMKFVSTWHRV